jgi:5'-methylthioadenosine phosphorylase
MLQPFGFSETPTNPQAVIGVFGGSGFYSLIDNPTLLHIETPYGPPSDALMMGTIAGKPVAFLPRHGRQHTIPPHLVNYRANVWAMKAVGCHTVVSPCAAGSLQRAVEPGHFVVCDQYVDRTNNRRDTFFDGPLTTHVSAADPFDEESRQWAIQAAKDCDITVHERGTVVVIQGPRFSTRSESQWFNSQGWEVINMTQYPEVHLVRELNMYPVNISLITDYDCGVDGIGPVSHEAVIEVFKANNNNLKRVLHRLVELIPAQRPTADYLSSARLG